MATLQYSVSDYMLSSLDTNFSFQKFLEAAMQSGAKQVFAPFSHREIQSRIEIKNIKNIDLIFDRHATLTASPAIREGVFILRDCENLNVKYLNLDGGLPKQPMLDNGHDGVRIFGGKNVTLEECTIKKFGDAGLRDTHTTDRDNPDKMGSYSQNSGLNLLSNRFIDCGQVSLGNPAGCRRSLLQHNSFQGSPLKYTSRLMDAGAHELLENSFYFSYSGIGGDVAIIVEGSKDLTFINNSISGYKKGVQLMPNDKAIDGALGETNNWLIAANYFDCEEEAVYLQGYRSSPATPIQNTRICHNRLENEPSVMVNIQGGFYHGLQIYRNGSQKNIVRLQTNTAYSFGRDYYIDHYIDHYTK